MKIRVISSFLAAAAWCLPAAWAEQPPTPAAAPAVPNAEAADTEVIDTDEIEAIDGTPDYNAPESRKPGEVPAMFRDDSMLDDSIINQELGINVYTAPSISKIFNQLDDLPAIPDAYVLRKRPEKLSTEAGRLALEMGYLMADGFIAVRSGHMNDIKPIALDLVRYGKALGVGDKMNAHSASLLENAEKGQIEEFKRNLASTQEDVNAEFVSLRDPDLAHLIALGGWVRALEAATAAISSKFDAKQASAVFYPDGPAYFSEILDGLNPQTSEKMHIHHMRKLLDKLTEQMTLPEGSLPTPEQVEALHLTIKQLSDAALGEKS
ncbi:MAG: hypothetical protein J1E42_05265 [Akkermansiaceae bacterium]|nr:hypothetical protein [Akkermansiaceae bacterium]